MVTLQRLTGEGMDTLHYAPIADDATTTDTDESMIGIGATVAP